MTRRNGAIVHAGDPHPVLTADRLRSWTDRLAAGFRTVGIGPGDVIVADLPNSPAFVVTLHAAWATGAAFAPMNPLLTPREKRNIIDLVQPRAILTSAELAPDEAAVPWPDPLSGPPEIGRSCVRSVVPGSAADTSDRLVLFTSGSTGKPKAVALTEANVSAGIDSVADHFALTEDDRTVAMLPWSHGHGLFASLLAPLHTGGTVVLPTPQQIQQPHQIMAAAEPTWLTLVPPQLELITGALERSNETVPRMRFLRTASSPLPRALAERAERLFRCCAVQALGMTETSHQAAADTPTWDRRLGTVGGPTGGMQVRFSGEDLLGGSELEVRGPGLFRCYLGDTEATAAAMTADGWFRTGDIATIEDSRIRLVTRLSEIVNRGGYKIAPAEVETVLSQHPDVVGALVTGIDHPTLGQELVAVVVVRDGTTAGSRDLIRYCRPSLAGHKVPGQIKLVQALPQLPNGKPSRRLAAELFKATA